MWNTQMLKVNLQTNDILETSHSSTLQITVFWFLLEFSDNLESYLSTYDNAIII